MLLDLLLKQTQLILGFPHTYNSGIWLIYLANEIVASIHLLLKSTYFLRPIDCIVNHAPAAPIPVLEPYNVGTAYAPPDHVAIEKNAYYLNYLVLKRTVETPFGANPCLC